MNTRKIANSLKASEHALSSGSYLERAVELAGIFGMAHYEAVLRAFKAFMAEHAKPDGLSEFLAEFDIAVLHCARGLGLSDDELRPLAWAVDLRALSESGLAHLRG